MHNSFHGQVSESLRLGVLLAIVGGFLEAYTFLSRGGVFANCETGNLVLLALYCSQGQFQRALTYLPPIAAFFLGVLLTDRVRRLFSAWRGLHWRQVTVLFEMLCLTAAAFVADGRFDIAVTTLIAFACSLQAQSFRKVHGSAYATTMCTGNLRSAADSLHAALFLRDRAAAPKAARYFAVLLVFMGGAVLGGVAVHFLREKAVLLCALPLLAAFFLMFIPTAPAREAAQ